MDAEVEEEGESSKRRRPMLKDQCMAAAAMDTQLRTKCSGSPRRNKNRERARDAADDGLEVAAADVELLEFSLSTTTTPSTPSSSSASSSGDNDKERVVALALAGGLLDDAASTGTLSG